MVIHESFKTDFGAVSSQWDLNTKIKVYTFTFISINKKFEWLGLCSISTG